MVVYCRSLNMVADLYAHFLYTLGDDSYYPEGAQHISDNRLFGMYHANTSPHNKEVIQTSMLDADGVVRIVFSTCILAVLAYLFLYSRCKTAEFVRSIPLFQDDGNSCSDARVMHISRLVLVATIISAHKDCDYVKESGCLQLQFCYVVTPVKLRHSIDRKAAKY